MATADKDTYRHPDDDDAQLLTSMGYSQELLRGFSGWVMSLAFCFTAVSVVPSIATSMTLATGGPGEILWAWIVCSVFTIISGLALAEVCSTYPSAGSVYHWSGQLAPGPMAPALSYITGWLNLLGNAAADAAFAWGFAGLVATTLQSNGSGVVLSSGAQTGIAIAVAFGWAVINVFRIDHQGWFNNFAMVWQIATAFIVVIVLYVLGSKSANGLRSASFAWLDWNNTTGFSNVDGYVVLLGLLSSLFSFSGYEASAHLAEETRYARRSAPIGIVLTCVISALVGFWYLLGLVFNLPPHLSSSSSSSATSTAVSTDDFHILSSAYPVVTIYFVPGNISAGNGLSALTIVAIFFGGTSSLTTTTRIAFAMARDGALPGSGVLRFVWPFTQSPIWTVALVFIVDALLMLLPLGSTSALTAILSVSVLCYQLSYAIPLFLRVTIARRTFQKGDFHLGPASEPVTWIAALWLTITSIFFFWPTSSPVTVKNMNWTIVVVAGVALIALLWWLAYARLHFKGPQRRAHDLPLIGERPAPAGATADSALEADCPTSSHKPHPTIAPAEAASLVASDSTANPVQGQRAAAESPPAEGVDTNPLAPVVV